MKEEFCLACGKEKSSAIDIIDGKCSDCSERDKPKPNKLKYCKHGDGPRIPLFPTAILFLLYERFNDPFIGYGLISFAILIWFANIALYISGENITPRD